MLKNMKVKKSLLLGFGVIIAASLIIIIVCIAMMLNQRNQYETLMIEDVEANQQIIYARLNAVLAGRNYRDALLVPESEANDGLIDTARESLATMEEYLKLLDENWPVQLTTDKREAYQEAARTWAESAEGIVQLYEQYEATGDMSYVEQAVDLIYTTDTPLQTAMANAADALDVQLVEGMASERAKIENSIMTTIITIIVVLVIVTILVIALAFALVKGITGPTEEVRRALVGFSEGKLDIPVNYESKNELGEMCRALKESQNILNSVIQEASYLLGEMAKGNFALSFRDESIYVGALVSMRDAIRTINRNLSDTLTQIDQSAEQVSAGSDQVSTGSQALAQGATEQASAVEELSATVSEIANNAQNNAKNSGEAMRMVQETGNQLTVSVEHMEEMVKAMSRISASSEEISKTIAIIENIAFQTNILALNAAVEAARAGSAGKGFAVVADEVRNLASKSDQAAKTTKDLIENSVSAVKEGDEIVKNVSDSLIKTREMTAKVVSSIEMIAKAAEEESEAIAQVTEGIDQISSVVQTNSATSEESAAASEELSSQASLMKELMGKFTLRQADGYSAPSQQYGYQAADSAADMPSGNAFSKY